MLFAVGIELAGQTQGGELAAAGGREGMVALDAVQIAVKDARVAFGAEEDERIGKRFEEGFDGRFESLVGLGVMVPGIIRVCMVGMEYGIRTSPESVHVC